MRSTLATRSAPAEALGAEAEVRRRTSICHAACTFVDMTRAPPIAVPVQCTRSSRSHLTLRVETSALPFSCGAGARRSALQRHDCRPRWRYITRCDMIAKLGTCRVNRSVRSVHQSARERPSLHRQAGPAALHLPSPTGCLASELRAGSSASSANSSCSSVVTVRRSRRQG